MAIVDSARVAFDDEAPAQAFDEAIHDQKVKERKQTGYGESGGVYPYETAHGTRWRCKVKRSDGKWTHKRGFTSPSAATNWRRRQLERVKRRRCRTRTCAICRCTICGTPRRRPGWRAATP